MSPGQAARPVHPRRSRARQVTLADVTPGRQHELEDDFKAWVIDLAEALGFLVYCVRDSRAVLATTTSRGFPDLVITHPTQRFLAFVETKQDGRYPDPAQRAWLAALRLALTVPYTPAMLAGLGTWVVAVWRPEDRPTIERLLREVVGQ